MDAIEFMKKLQTMHRIYRKNCSDCPIGIECDKEETDSCEDFIAEHSEKAVKIVEDWMPNTRQFKILEMLPNAWMDNGVLDLCPIRIVSNFKCISSSNCSVCKREFWLTEVE